MDKMIVPANFMSWPRIADLLPDQKLIARELWCNQFCRLHGCYTLPIKMFAASLSLQETALTGALRDFEERKLINMDWGTGEVYILDWLRFHVFKGWSVSEYWKAVDQIQSSGLRELVMQKSVSAGIKRPTANESTTCQPTATTTPTSTSTSTKNKTTPERVEVSKGQAELDTDAPKGAPHSRGAGIQGEVKSKSVCQKELELLMSEGVEESVADDFMNLRKTKKSPITKTALNLIKKEADKASISLNEAIKICCARGWAGFCSDWLPNEKKKFDPLAYMNRNNPNYNNGAGCGHVIDINPVPF